MIRTKLDKYNEPCVKRMKPLFDDEMDDFHATIHEDFNEDLNEDDEMAVPEIAEEIEIDENEKYVRFNIGQTKFKKLALHENGFRYIHNSGPYFRCDLSRVASIKCKVWVKVNEEINDEMDFVNGSYTNQTQHSHLPNFTRNEVDKMVQKIKTDARKRSGTSKHQIRHIIAKNRNGISDEAFVEKKTGALQKMAKRARAEEFGKVDVKKIWEKEIPQKLVEMDDGTNFLIVDRTTNQDRMLIFAHPEALRILGKSRHWCIDGTFKCSPGGWIQCLVIGANIQGKIVICCNALLTSKEQANYEFVLNAVRERIAPNTPYAVISDFEKGELNAIKNVFPSAIRVGCHFHFCQSMWRRFRELHLDKLFNDTSIDERPIMDLIKEIKFGDEGRTIGKMAYISFRAILALPLLPRQFLQRAFFLITSIAPPGMENFFFYFAKNYLGLDEIGKKLKSDAYKGNAIDFKPDQGQAYKAIILEDDQPVVELESNQSLIPGTSSSLVSSTIVSLDHSYTNSDTIPVELSLNDSLNVVENIQVRERHKLPIICPPLFAQEIWNLNNCVEKCVAKTNNALEGSHFHFSRTLNMHPSLSDFLISFKEDIIVQLDKFRSIKKNVEPPRNPKNLMKEELIRQALNEAAYDTDSSIIATIYELGILMRGMLKKLSDQRPINAENDEKSDFDAEAELSDQRTINVEDGKKSDFDAEAG